MFRTGYIVGPQADWIWFLGLPFAAVVVALGAQAWLPYVAVASFNLWITVPHHYAGWVRTYGVPEEFSRFRTRLVLGPMVLMTMAAAGLVWFPITLLLIVTAWDHQHSLMQQHGFSRIYDFKAKTGVPRTGRFDLALHWILYGHMLLTAPMFRHLLIRELYQMHIEISVELVATLIQISWMVVIGYIAIYLWHLRSTVRNGGHINPIKYIFIGSSYFLWYFTAWHTNSILLFAVAHRIMHGFQYMVIVWLFLNRKARQEQSGKGVWRRLVGEGRLKWFLLAGGVYAILFQLLISHPMDTFGFGVVNFAAYDAVPEFGLPQLDYTAAYGLFSQALISAFGMTHYYMDSFIWKVSDSRVQKGL